MTERKGNTLLSIKNLEKTYQGGVLAVKDVSFEVKEKEVVVIIGASGSGKSTVLRCVNQLICLLYTSPSPRDRQKSRMPSSA